MEIAMSHHNLMASVKVKFYHGYSIVLRLCWIWSEEMTEINLIPYGSWCNANVSSCVFTPTRVAATKHCIGPFSWSGNGPEARNNSLQLHFDWGFLACAQLFPFPIQRLARKSWHEQKDSLAVRLSENAMDLWDWSMRRPLPSIIQGLYVIDINVISNFHDKFWVEAQHRRWS